jgi:hypothetical protein
MRKIICSIGLGTHKILSEIAEPTLQNFATKYGYELRIISGPVRKPWAERIAGFLHLNYNKLPQRFLWKILGQCDIFLGRFMALPRPTSWGKIPLVRSLLEDYDAVFWIDADAIIVDDTQDIAAEITRDKWLYLAQTTSAQGPHLNAGVFFILSCATSKRFLDEVWKQRDLTYHRWWEQAAMLRLLGYDPDSLEKVALSRYEDGVKVVPTSWNCIPPSQEAMPRIRHYAGMSQTERVTLMTSDLVQWRSATATVE